VIYTSSIAHCTPTPWAGPLGVWVHAEKHPLTFGDNNLSTKTDNHIGKGFSGWRHLQLYYREWSGNTFMDPREVKQICSESACPLVALCIRTERSIVAGNQALLLARLIVETTASILAQKLCPSCQGELWLQLIEF